MVAVRESDHKFSSFLSHLNKSKQEAVEARGRNAGLQLSHLWVTRDRSQSHWGLSVFRDMQSPHTSDTKTIINDSSGLTLFKGAWPSSGSRKAAPTFNALSSQKVTRTSPGPHLVQRSKWNKAPCETRQKECFPCKPRAAVCEIRSPCQREFRISSALKEKSRSSYGGEKPHSFEHCLGKSLFNWKRVQLIHGSTLAL